MKGINDAVLRRRQLDLDKRTADLQKYFERLANQKMAGMADNWKELEYRLRHQVRMVYKEMGALQNPRKIKALKGKAERLEAFLSQIQQDIVTNGGRQQPYYTGVLKHQFEKAYYMNAWGLEQAAKITATVPMLTPAQVLGVLINPWLSDGANYSDRIRANTAFLAQEMKVAIQQAVEEGLDWNTVAHNITKKTGEGYFRAVRLARTELNRAAALGASYSYLQNQDVLDGKRWNAVLDLVTAPKDAANDTKVFDLDYDTPENPGVPGKRIPNHPNCRCIWCPILSALGINSRERIARDKDGQWVYTKAGNYREYAKERGLPDLDDRLNNDYLKSYLRPGENVVDLQKTVKRWTYQGKTIQVPTPDWTAVPKVIPPIATPKTVPPIATPKTVPPIAAGFQEAKTVQEASTWAMEVLKIDHVDYKGFDVRLANNINKTLDKLKTRYPEGASSLRWITTSQTRNKAYVARKLAEKGLDNKATYIEAQYRKYVDSALKNVYPGLTEADLPKTAIDMYRKMATDAYTRDYADWKKLFTPKRTGANNWASATNDTWKEQAGVCFNEKIAADFDSLAHDTAYNVQIKYHPVGCEEPASILTHEYGHQLDYYLQRTDPDLRRWVIAEYRNEAYKQYRGMKEQLSEYATDNDKEFFAEAFSEYIHNPNPRPVAKEVGRRLEEALEKIRKKVTP